MKGIIIAVPLLKPLTDYVEECALQDRWRVSEEDTPLEFHKKTVEAINELLEEYLEYCEDPMIGLPSIFDDRYDPNKLLLLLEDLVFSIEVTTVRAINRCFRVWDAKDIIPIVCMDKVLVIF